jgi:hypothetical protein
MNAHLNAVRLFHDALLFQQAEPGGTERMSDMDVIQYQALLMEAGSEVLKAIKAGEMSEILLGLTDLAYVALAAIARQGGEVTDQPVTWRLDGYVLSVMQIVSDKISHCTSGETDKYSAVYCLCVHLARGFVNADFDKAFQKIHEHNMSRVHVNGESLYSDTDKLRASKLQKSPDLNDCLYE